MDLVKKKSIVCLPKSQNLSQGFIMLYRIITNRPYCRNYFIRFNQLLHYRIR